MPRINSYGLVNLPGLHMAFNPQELNNTQMNSYRLDLKADDLHPGSDFSSPDTSEPVSSSDSTASPFASVVDVVHAKKELSALLLAIADLRALLDGSMLPLNLLSL